MKPYKKKKYKNKSQIVLTKEQNEFIETALLGTNILVDACVGSGKTTSIQKLCNRFPANYNILYLTYNHLLKIDAQKKIKNNNVLVQNYHGYVSTVLYKMGIKSSVSEIITKFNHVKPIIEHFDVLIIDEYQDINEELATLLEWIKESNKSIQIIAVGDMQQKIYDDTVLNVNGFIKELLGDYTILKFTTCFRLPKKYANYLGKIWNKEIHGINNNCDIDIMNTKEVIRYLSKKNPSDILCLGNNNSESMNEVLNKLESIKPNKFNKNSVYASIKENDSNTRFTLKDSAIFTTYDSSKGLERPICVIFDYTINNWLNRLSRPSQKQDILKNIFMVALSRGKSHIIFVKNEKFSFIKSMDYNIKTENTDKTSFIISDAFDYKYKESVRKCFLSLTINKISVSDNTDIKIKNTDGLIDLSPCIGIYQEACFFNHYDIEKEINYILLFKSEKQYKHEKEYYDQYIKNTSLNKKILYLTYLQTKKKRYIDQVLIPFINQNEESLIVNRLSNIFSKDETVQKNCSFEVSFQENKKINLNGICDVIKDNVVYELKFVDELTPEHFLQCAMYMIGLNLEQGILWNVKKNEMFSIKIPDKEKLKQLTYLTLTKSSIDLRFDELISNTTFKKTEKKNTTDIINPNSDFFSVIDVETNFDNEIISLGIVISEWDNFSIIENHYFIFSPECQKTSLYFGQLFQTRDKNINLTKGIRSANISELINLLKKYNIKNIFAYNANFDMRCLPELNEYKWFDIMKIAAYKQHNDYLPDTLEYCKTGRLKSNYSFEVLYKLISNNPYYVESHNALDDATDELSFMHILNKPKILYMENAMISSNKNAKKH